MARLCKEMNSLFSEFVLKNLRLCGFHTVFDFLEENPENLVRITKLSYKDIVLLRHNIIANFSAFQSSGKTAYNEIVTNSAMVSTGIERYSSCSTFDVTETLKRIEVVRVKDLYQLFSFLHTLRENLAQRELESSFVRVIILDSLPAVFFSFLNDTNNEGIALKSQLANTMKHIALECHVAFLLVNLASRHFDEIENLPDPDLTVSSVQTEIVKPALGKQWLHIPSTRLLLKKVESQVHVSIIKSINIPLCSSCILNIKDEGLV
ncbi:Putative DNA repair protein RAD51-like protein 4 [Gryllus bimaculatus]|nr:Putative DNA repair protein RAD51-like protein 4 [Gryllus bimaculatus]